MVLSFYNIRSSDYSKYSKAALEDALHLVLSSKYECEVYEEEDENANGPSLYLFHPYLNQAEGLIHKVNISRPPPEFVIWQDDIPDKLARTLQALGKIKMTKVITEVVRRLYESVDPDYFHTNGIYGKARWRIAK